MSVVHWDDRPGDDLAIAVGSAWACLRHVRIGPGDPLHLDADDRETVVWTLDRDALVVRRPGDVERSIRAEGTIDVLVCAADAPLADPLAPARTGAIVRPSEVDAERVVDGQTAVTRRDIGAPAGAVTIGVELVDVAPGRRSVPAVDLEEVAVVLQGSGRAVVGDAEATVIRGSVVGHAERFLAGPQGLRVLSFRKRTRHA